MTPDPWKLTPDDRLMALIGLVGWIGALLLTLWR